MIAEALIVASETGLQPADEGWFILNLADVSWRSCEGVGIFSMLEPEHASRRFGIGVHILHPGDAPGFYHAEDDQEGFLVLSGECIAIVEGQERRMRPWDYLHSPPGCAHMTVGAADGPCAILMVGSRSGDAGATRYIQDAVAARHGVSPPMETTSAGEVYADRPPIVPARSPWPLAARMSPTGG